MKIASGCSPRWTDLSEVKTFLSRKVVSGLCRDAQLVSNSLSRENEEFRGLGAGQLDWRKDRVASASSINEHSIQRHNEDMTSARRSKAIKVSAT